MEGDGLWQGEGRSQSKQLRDNLMTLFIAGQALVVGVAGGRADHRASSWGTI
jgi:hypothetical protein